MSTLIDWHYPQTVLKRGELFYSFKAPPVMGAVPVYWLVDTQWVHKGWMMPEVT